MDKTDKLIELLSKNLVKQDSQIKKLDGLATNQQNTNTELLAQTLATKSQTAYLQDNSKPDISIDNLLFIKSVIDTSTESYYAVFSNSGGRTLLDLHSEFFFFPKTKVVKDSIYFLIVIVTS